MLTPKPVQNTQENLMAANYLVRVRGRIDQGVFADRLTQQLRVRVSQSSLSRYEKAEHRIPAAVLIAASEVTGEPIVLDPAGAMTLADQVWRELLGRAKALGWPTEPSP